MNQTGGKTSSNSSSTGQGLSTIGSQKIIKGHLGQLFQSPPVDTSVEKSKWEIYRPTNATMNPLQISVDRTRSWIDLSMIQFEYDVEFLKGDNVLVTNADKVFPINNTGHSLIKQFELKINGESVGETSESYHIKAYITRLYNHSKEEKECQLTQEGWATDTPGLFDSKDPIPSPQLDPTINQANIQAAMILLYDGRWRNHGAHKRHKWCCQGRKVKFIITPIIDVCQSEKYLVPGCLLDFKIRWNEPKLVLMTEGTVAAPTFRIVADSPRMHIRHVEAEKDLHLFNESNMLTNKYMAIYPCMTTRIVTMTIPNGRRQSKFNNVFQGYRPNYLIMGFQRGDAFTGSYDRNPFNFCDMGLSMIRLTCNGDEIPYERMYLSSHERLEGYSTIQGFTGKMMESGSVGLSRDDYKDGNYLLLYNLNPDGRQNIGYDYSKNLGIINIDMDFSQETANNTTIVCYGEFENKMVIDGNKNISMMYAY